jgi:hypothetical protein
MCEECLTVHNLITTGLKKVENDGLEGKNLFVFMYEINSGDLVLDIEPTEHSYI